MSDELTTAEAEKLFNQVSKAVQTSDGEKLSELMDKKPVEDVAPDVDQPEEKEEELPDTPPDDSTDKDETPDPSKETDQTEEVKDEDKKEPDELEKLRTQLAQLSKENHALKSQAGRVPHVQRKLKELDKKLEELATAHASPSSQPSAKIKPKIDELLKGVRGTDPELADAIAQAIAEATDSVAEDMRTKEKDTLTLLREQEFSTYQAQEAERLLELYPNAPEVFNSPSWAEWKTAQSPRMRGLAESDSADDVATAFELYAKDMVAKYPELNKVAEKKDETPNSDPADAEKAKQVEAERARKKQSSVNLSNPSAPAKVSMPDDPVALFEKYSEQIRKERTGG